MSRSTARSIAFPFLAPLGYRKRRVFNMAADGIWLTAGKRTVRQVSCVCIDSLYGVFAYLLVPALDQRLHIGHAYSGSVRHIACASLVFSTAPAASTRARYFPARLGLQERILVAVAVRLRVVGNLGICPILLVCTR